MLKQRTINQLVGDNHVFASVLHYFGIAFYDYSEKTLEQACADKNLDAAVVVRHLEDSAQDKNEARFPFNELPLELVLEYLIHKHHYFVKMKLPFIGQLIYNLSATTHPTLARDLKFVFPVFVEDFIHHIYEEEDTLFKYIKTLLKVKQNCGTGAYRLLGAAPEPRINRFALDHDLDEDEMKGFRDITDNYSLCHDESLHVRVIYTELRQLEEELKLHARVENTILFPKALSLEQDVFSKVLHTRSLN